MPSNSQRDYRAVFYCYERWNFQFKVTSRVIPRRPSDKGIVLYFIGPFNYVLWTQVTFTNEEGEYQFYEIEYEVTEPEVMESIKLTTPVRLQICHALKVENPLEHEPITFTAECFHPFITLSQVPKTVKPLSHVSNCQSFRSHLPLCIRFILLLTFEYSSKNRRISFTCCISRRCR